MNPAYILIMALAVNIGTDMHKERIKIPYERQMNYAGRKTQRWFFNNYNGAEINYANAIRMDSTNYEAFYRRGKLRQMRKHCYPELARQDLQKSLDLINMDIEANPSDTLYWSRGHIKRHLTGNMTDACEDFKTAGEFGKGSHKCFCTDKKD